MSQKIQLQEYDLSWPEKFQAEKKIINEVIGDFVCGSIEHVGSTSIPGLMAKPIIDIMVGVESLSLSKPCIQLLEKDNYKYFPYKTNVMHWFCKPSDEFRTHHLHLIPYKSGLWQERIKFKNLLLNDNSVAKNYQSLKIELAKKHENDREKYTQEKWPFIKEALLKNEH